MNGLFHGQGRYWQTDGAEYVGQWYRNEIRGEGVKKLKQSGVELGGHFVGGQVCGKGYKKWRRMGRIPTGSQGRTMK